jgi:rhodanese-related sulfurtransferase
MTENNDKGNGPLRISVEEAKARKDSGQPIIIIDVDDPDSYAGRDRKISGARRIDPRDLAEATEELPSDQAILAYCTCPNEETSASVAFFLRKNGGEAYAIAGGLEAWRDAGFPLETKEA